MQWTESYMNLFLASLIIRVVLVMYSEWQDRNFVVKYTDIDYQVFTDAAKYVTEGESPYRRTTYRYTPLLALILTPNVYILKSFGKLIFIGCDLIIGYIISQLIDSRMSLALWLFNPFVIGISTRGNAESFICVLVYLTLFHIYKNTKHVVSDLLNTFYAAIWFGLAVHVKIYPIIYTPSILVFLNEKYDRNCSSKLFNKHRVIFAFTSATIFFLLGFGFYHIYGMEFLEHSYLYHLTRKDHRHNFSLYFYYMYTSFFESGTKLWTFIPQIFLSLFAGIRYGQDLIFACFLQTLIFVTFNKVITSQYFMWYLCFLPVLKNKLLSISWFKTAVLLISWITSQSIWLHNAYNLEFMGKNTFVKIHLSTMLFFCVNTWILLEIINSYNKTLASKNVKEE
jgi:phosphatidylinositol glycan class M